MGKLKKKGRNAFPYLVLVYHPAGLAQLPGTF
jgi:hypothetical protein